MYLSYRQKKAKIKYFQSSIKLTIKKSTQAHNCRSGVPAGAEPFSGESGCGCGWSAGQTATGKPKVIPAETNETNNLEKNYCKPEQREEMACIALYQPVCGWFDETIKCVKYPCAQTYSNGCVACQDEKVEYWTEGECTE